MIGLNCFGLSDFMWFYFVFCIVLCIAVLLRRNKRWWLTVLSRQMNAHTRAAAARFMSHGNNIIYIISCTEGDKSLLQIYDTSITSELHQQSSNNLRRYKCLFHKRNIIQWNVLYYSASNSSLYKSLSCAWLLIIPVIAGNVTDSRDCSEVHYAVMESHVAYTHIYHTEWP